MKVASRENFKTHLIDCNTFQYLKPTSSIATKTSPAPTLRMEDEKGLRESMLGKSQRSRSLYSFGLSSLCKAVLATPLISLDKNINNHLCKDDNDVLG